MRQVNIGVRAQNFNMLRLVAAWQVGGPAYKKKINTFFYIVIKYYVDVILKNGSKLKKVYEINLTPPT